MRKLSAVDFIAESSKISCILATGLVKKITVKKSLFLYGYLQKFLVINRKTLIAVSLLIQSIVHL